MAALVIFIQCGPGIEERWCESASEDARIEYEAEQSKLDMADRHRCDCCQIWVDRSEDLTVSGDDVLCNGCSPDDSEVN